MEEVMTTKFRTLIKILRAKKGDMTQEELAKNLGYSSSQFSYIMNGKVIPDLDFFIKCQNFFELDKTSSIELLQAILSSSNTINLNLSYLSSKRKEWLIDIIMALVLYPDIESYDELYEKIDKGAKQIKASLENAKKIELSTDKKS
jgi:transcriptional regulator with XRE-family HTH domain